MPSWRTTTPGGRSWPILRETESSTRTRRRGPSTPSTGITRPLRPTPVSIGFPRSPRPSFPASSSRASRGTADGSDGPALSNERGTGSGSTRALAGLRLRQVARQQVQAEPEHEQREEGGDALARPLVGRAADDAVERLEQ